MALLELRDLSVRFGGLQAVSNLNLSVHRGEIVSLIGPNGAGKTTTFNCVSGTQLPSTGSVQFKDANLTEAPPHARARQGIGRTFQQVQLFHNLTAMQNVLVAAEAAEGTLSPFQSMLRGPGARRRERILLERAEAALALTSAADLASLSAGSLSLGQARLVELARALACAPELLLLDEPASGLDEGESHEFGETILRIRDELGITVFMVEHDVPLVARISDEIYVLDFGKLIANGPTDVTLRDPKVIAAYLGTEVMTS